jgi:hypothetical protein
MRTLRHWEFATVTVLRAVRGPEAHAAAGTDDGMPVPAPQAPGAALRAVHGVTRPPAPPEAAGTLPPVPATPAPDLHPATAVRAAGMTGDVRPLLIEQLGVGWRLPRPRRLLAGQGQRPRYGLGARLPAAERGNVHAAGGGRLAERPPGGQGHQDGAENPLAIFPGVQFSRTRCGHAGILLVEHSFASPEISHNCCEAVVEGGAVSLGSRALIVQQSASTCEQGIGLRQAMLHASLSTVISARTRSRYCAVSSAVRW